MGGGDAAVRAQSRNASASSSTRPRRGHERAAREAAARVPAPRGADSRPARTQREDGEGLREDARLPRARRAKASSRATSPSAARPSGAATPPTFHRKWHEELEVGARGARSRHEAEARRTPRQPRRQRVLHQRLRRGADRHARRLRLGPRRQRAASAATAASSACTASSSRIRSARSTSR